MRSEIEPTNWGCSIFHNQWIRAIVLSAYVRMHEWTYEYPFTMMTSI
jgi:hypothetical protein